MPLPIMGMPFAFKGMNQKLKNVILHPNLAKGKKHL